LVTLNSRCTSPSAEPLALVVKSYSTVVAWNGTAWSLMTGVMPAQARLSAASVGQSPRPLPFQISTRGASRLRMFCDGGTKASASSALIVSRLGSRTAAPCEVV
jgi:hypothetical protein